MSKSRNLTPDQHNANRGTERGRHMLETSLRKLGAGRSILLDKHGNVIAGNKTLEVANEIGLEDVQIVQSDGRRLIAVQRTDLDLTDPTGKARQLAYADNRVGEVDLEWNADALRFDVDQGFDFGDWFQGYELVELGVMSPDFSPVGADEQPRLDQKSPITCPHCGEEFVPE